MSGILPDDPRLPPAGTSTNPLDEPRPKTPPRSEANVHSALKDTPAKARPIDHSSYRNGTLGERRDVVLEDLGQTIPEVELQFFVKNILPPLRDGFEPSEIVKSLTDDGYIIEDSKSWKNFQTDPKERRGVHESKVFDPIAEYFISIVNAANKKPHGHEQTLVFRKTPNSTPQSERASTTRPDGYMILKEAEDRAAPRSWYDIALTAEDKKRDSTAARNQNVSQIIYSMQQTMSLDPCRRFTFGITIENTETRLWFCSRAVMLVSKPFNFNKDFEMLVHVFLSFAFASKTELGWDPTFTFVRNENNVRVYEIKVGDQIFETVEILSDFGADAVIGRGSRVFKVKRKSDGVFAVLKDVWVDDDRNLEHDIHEQMLSDVEEKFGMKAKRKVQKYLLTPLCAGRVKIGNEIDHTTKIIMRNAVPSFDNVFKLVPVETEFNEKKNSKGYSLISDRLFHGTRAPRENPRKFIHHRVHYRIVFREVAVPLYSVKKLSDVFVALRDISKVLQYIHGCGWVHRDISAGNVYLYKGRGLLGDLEYAKIMGTNAEHEVRTGTLDFMAIEVAVRGYRFLPLKSYVNAKQQLAKRYKEKNVDSDEEYSDIEEESIDDVEKAKRHERMGDAGEGLSSVDDKMVDMDEETRDSEPGDMARDLKNVGRKLSDTSIELGDASGRPGDTGKELVVSSEGQTQMPVDAAGRPSEQSDDAMEGQLKDLNDADVDEPAGETKGPNFWFNPLHDMESLWWSAVWTLFVHEDSSERTKRTDTEKSTQAEKASTFFPRRLDVSERIGLLVNEFFFMDSSRCLPDSFRRVVGYLEYLRNELRARYVRAEATSPTIDTIAFEGVHHEFIHAYDISISKADGIELAQFVFPTVQSNKRKAEDAQRPDGTEDAQPADGTGDAKALDDNAASLTDVPKRRRMFYHKVN